MQFDDLADGELHGEGVPWRRPVQQLTGALKG
jgi:hypothetical protein